MTENTKAAHDQAPIQSGELAKLRNLAEKAADAKSTLDASWQQFEDAILPRTILRLLDALAAVPAAAVQSGELADAVSDLRRILPMAYTGNTAAREHVNVILRLLAAVPAAPTHEQVRRTGYGEGVRKAAQLMEGRGLPEMAELIRNLQSTSLPAAQQQATTAGADLNGGMHASIFVKVWGDAGGGDAGRIALAQYAYDLGRAAQQQEQSCDDESYELVQDDMIVSVTSGRNALAEMRRYAAQYEQDGPVEIFKCSRTTIYATPQGERETEQKQGE